MLLLLAAAPFDETVIEPPRGASASRAVHEGAAMGRLIRTVLVGMLLVAGLAVTAATATAAPFTGVVRSGDGTPLSGATVAILDETGKGIAASTTTAPDGSYSLECPTCVNEMFAAADGYSTQRGGPDFTLFAIPHTYVGSAGTSKLTFAWNAVPGAAAYRLTLADEPTFKNPKIIVRETGTAHTYQQLLRNHLYYLQVYPVDADSHVIRPDRWLGDSTRPLAGRTGYVNNLHVTDRASNSLAFAWAPLSFSRCCARYEVQLSSSPTFAGYRSKWSAAGDTTLTFTNLTSGKLYYVRVRARNPSNTYTTGWSGTRTTATL